MQRFDKATCFTILGANISRLFPCFDSYIALDRVTSPFLNFLNTFTGFLFNQFLQLLTYKSNYNQFYLLNH